MLEVASDAFGHNETIPRKFTGEGEDRSPPLRWSGAPEETETFALIADDPDAPQEEPWVHWIVYNIPGDTSSLPEGSANGGQEGLNSFGTNGYGGPMPPPEDGPHHYHFKVYALDTELELGKEVTKEKLAAAMRGHVVAEGELVALYER